MGGKRGEGGGGGRESQFVSADSRLGTRRTIKHFDLLKKPIWGKMVSYKVGEQIINSHSTVYTTFLRYSK